MLRHSLTLSLKILGRRPFFTFVSLFGISLTLAVLMLVAALLDQAFGGQPPEVHSDRTLGVFQVRLTKGNNVYRGQGGFRLFDQALRDMPGVEALSIASTPRAALSFVDGQRVSLKAVRVDPDYFRIMVYDFIEGGPIDAQDALDAAPVAVISRQSRQRLFAGQPAVGRSFHLEGRRYEVRGVVENVPAFRALSSADVWLSLAAEPSASYRLGYEGDFRAFALAAPESDLESLRGEIQNRLESVDVASHSAYENLEVLPLTPVELTAQRWLRILTFVIDSEGLQALVEDVDSLQRSPVDLLRLMLALAALLFMILPSLNLINLNISRILERAAEIGVRKSFGASSRALIGQFLIENVVLTLIGGVIGFLLATVALQLISGTALVSYAEIGGLNLRLFGSALLLTLFFGVLSGVYPAWRMSRLHPQQVLRETAS